MTYHPLTTASLAYLQSQPSVRQQIRAAPNRTLLYAGAFFKPVWKEIADLKRTHPEWASKELLPDVLARIAVPGTPHPSLLAYVQDVERQVPWKPDGFTLWRALSGLFASHAIGAVTFQIGGGVTVSDKVFAATELGVLARNPHVDATTKDLLAYFQGCVARKDATMNLGFLSA